MRPNLSSVPLQHVRPVGLEPLPLSCPMPPSGDPRFQLHEWADAAPTDWLVARRRACVDTILSAVDSRACAWHLGELDASVVPSLPEAAVFELVKPRGHEAVPVTLLELPDGLARLPSWVVSLDHLQTLSVGAFGQFERLNLRGLPHLQHVSVGAGLQRRLVVHVRVGCDVKLNGHACLRLRIYRHEGERIAAVECPPYWSQPTAINVNGKVRLGDQNFLFCRQIAAIVMKLRAQYRIEKREDPETSWSLEDLGTLEELEALVTSDSLEADGRSLDARALNAADEIFFVHDGKLGEFLNAQCHAMHRADQKERYCQVKTINHSLFLCLTVRTPDREDNDRGVRRVNATLYDPNTTNDDCSVQALINADDGLPIGDGFKDWSWRRFIDARAPVSSLYFSLDSIHFGKEQCTTVGVYHTPESVLEMMTRKVRQPAISFAFMPSENPVHPSMMGSFARTGALSILSTLLARSEELPREAAIELLVRINPASVLMREGYAEGFSGYVSAIRDACATGLLNGEDVKVLLKMVDENGRSPYQWMLQQRDLPCAAAWVEEVGALQQCGILTSDDVHELCADADAKGLSIHQRLLSGNSADAFLLHVAVVAGLHARGSLAIHHVAGLVAADLQGCTFAACQAYVGGLMNALTVETSVERRLPEALIGYLMLHMHGAMGRRSAVTVSACMELLQGFCRTNEIRGERLRQLVPAGTYSLGLLSGDCLHAFGQALVNMVHVGLLQAVDVSELCLSKGADGVAAYQKALQVGDKQAFLAHAVTVVGLQRAGVLRIEELGPLLSAQGLLVSADMSAFYLETVGRLLG